ncbi:MAG: sensor histidine kinase [Thermoplasmatota archaeon]
MKAPGLPTNEISSLRGSATHRVFSLLFGIGGPGALSFALVIAALGLQTHSGHLLLTGILVLAFGILLTTSWILFRRNRSATAIWIATLGIQAVSVALAFVVPEFFPTLLLTPALSVAIAIPYLDRRSFVVVACISGLVSVLTIAAGLLLPSAPDVPQWFMTPLTIMASATCFTLAFLLLAGFRTRLDEAMDVSEQGRRRLEELNGMRNQFLENAAHELRTPLTPLRVRMHLLTSGSLGPMTPSQMNSLQAMDRNLTRLNRLVEDVLQVTILQSGALRVNMETMDLAALAHEAWEAFDPVARQAGIDLAPPTGGATMARGDPARLLQVLLNLVGNAIKFTPRGGTVRIETGSDGAFTFARVTDSGIGISSEDAGRLFVPFSRIERPDLEARPGAGLGLFVSRGIAEAHGGSLTVRSEGRGRGTTFELQVPRARESAPPLADAASTLSSRVAPPIGLAGPRLADPPRYPSL